MKTLKRQSASAFTLLEIMLVVMIIALLAGSAIYLMRGNVDTTRVVRAGTDVQNILTQVQLYQALNAVYPTTEQGVKALVERPSTPPVPSKWRRLMDDIPIDPWGQPYILQNPAQRSKHGVDVFSSGPDGVPGNSDDVGNW